jgi:hypothetical protein
MKNYTTEELKIELERRGYYTEKLWHIQDVRTRFDCSDEQALEVLSEVFSNGSVTETIHEFIHITSDYMGLGSI